MVTLASLSAVLLYLVPIAVVVAARSGRDSTLWEIALDIPLAVALDLISVLLLAKLLPLQIAAFVSRAGWIAGFALLLVRHHRGTRLERPIALGKPEIAAVSLAAAAAAALSVALSRTYSIWDRGWHTPLVASIRGQSIPFMNVYEPHGRLYYHFAGDALAAVLQSLSFSVIHSSLALSLAHDILFGLFGACLALLLREWGVRRALLIAIAVLGVLLAGPPSALRNVVLRPDGGYSYLSFFVLSFRPHMSLAALMILGFAGAVVSRLRSGGAPIHFDKTAPVLLFTTALLAITDEASIGVLGLALGVTWLIEPDVISPSRKEGLLVFVGLATALISPNILFSAALAPSAHRLPIAIVPWRLPGYYNAPLPLANPTGRAELTLDLLPMVAVLAAGLLRLYRRRERQALAMVVFYGALLVISTVLLTRIEVDHTPTESHRFVIAASLLAPIFGIAFIGPLRSGEGRSSKPALLGYLLVIGATGLGVASTLEWIYSLAPLKAQLPSVYDSRRNLYQVNCRADAGASLGGAPRPAYIAKSIWYLYAGCRPIFAPSAGSDHWALRVTWPQYGEDALADLHREMVAPNAGLDVICPSDPDEAATDSTCVFALRRSLCHTVGSRVAQCALSTDQRAQLLEAYRRSKAIRKAGP